MATARLQIGPEDGVLKVAVANEAAGIHIDAGQRLRLVNDQVAARLECDLGQQGLFDLVLDAVQIENRPRPGVELDALCQLGA